MGNSPSCFSSKHANTPEDVSNLLEVIKDQSDIEELISFIEQRLDALTGGTTAIRSQQDPSTSQPNAGTSLEPLVAVAPPKMTSCLPIGEKLLDIVGKRVQEDKSNRSFRLKLGEKTRKLVIDILKESVKIHWLAAGLSVLGYVLDQIDQVSTNKAHCVKLLRYMCALAKQVRELDEQLPQQRQKLNDVVNFILQGCVMCVSQMRNHRLLRLISASVDAQDIERFESEFGYKYQDLSMEAVIGLLKRTPHFNPPTQGRKPHAVGIEKAKNTVTRLLQVEVDDQTRRAVVIYGFGGVGKTTLASAVFCELDLTAYEYKFCRLVMEKSCSDEKIKNLQYQLLHDLFGRNIMPRDYLEGQEFLEDAFSKESTLRVFLFIDNALKNDDLKKLLPQNLSCLPKQTRILLTTRNLHESSMLSPPNIQRSAYRIDCLNRTESKKNLCKKVLGSADDKFQSDVDVEIDSLVEICGGIPLVLDIVGSKLSGLVNNASDCKKIIDSLKESLKEGKEEEICEGVVDVVYESLDPHCKEAFLDIACFFHNWERSFVSSVVGDQPLKDLENAVLVKITHDHPTSRGLGKFLQEESSTAWNKYVRDRDVREGFIEVHDIVRARGKKLSQTQADRRIMDVESLPEPGKDNQNLEKIKGICIRHPASEVKIDAKHLDLMHASLKTLYIGGEIKINGKWEKDFENLRCIYLYSNSSFCVDLAKLENLTVLRAEFSKNPSKLPSSLHCLELRAVPDFQLSLNDSFGNLSSLQELQLKNVVELPETFGHLKSLSLLRFHNCKMVTLPESFGRLCALEGLSIKRCDELESLPMRFGELQRLEFLEVRFCPKLSSLSENFGQLTSLRILNIVGCKGISTLPESFGSLSALEELSIKRCEKLERLPMSFGKLQKLAFLEVIFCFKLKSLSEDFVQLASLRILHLDGCELLSTLPDNFGNLSSLEELSLEWCSELLSLPESFGELSSLNTLEMCGCQKLARLPNNFVQLKSLEALCINHCSDLKEETMDVLVEMVKMKPSMFVNINGSPMLIERWKQVMAETSLPVSCTNCIVYSDGLQDERGAG